MTNAGKGRDTPRIVLTDPIDEAAQSELAQAAEVVVAGNTDALITLADTADIVVVRSPIPVAFVAAAPRLLGLIRYGSGVDMIPVAEASRHGIAVANTPSANARSVAEYVIGQMLSLARKTSAADLLLRQQGWAAARRLSSQCVELDGKTLGIIGMGGIGQQVAQIASRGLNMRVLCVRRSATSLPAGVERATLETLLAQADAVVLACPLSPETRGLLDDRHLRLMKPTAILINVSRGPVVDHAALGSALSQGRLAGAALDVFDTQPLAADSPLLNLPNVLLSPHMAGITRESLARMGQGVVRQALALLSGHLPRHLVNRDAEQAIRQRLQRIIKANID